MKTRQKYALTLIFLLTIFYLNVVGQTIADNTLRNDKSCVMKFDSTFNRSYYILVEKMPTYRGGQDTLMKIIKKNVMWPSGNCCINGTVYLSFIIESDGKVTNKRICRSAWSDDMVCSPNTQALKVMNYLTDWTAGQCNGKNVAVQFILPVTFNLK